MKKLSSMFLAVAFTLPVVGVVFAANPVRGRVENPPPMAEEKAAPAIEEKAAPAIEEKAAKPKSLEVTGTIESLDMAGGNFTVKGRKGSVSLMAGKKVRLSRYRVGDKVTVKYSNGVASSVKAKKSRSKKSAKKTAVVSAPKGVPPASTAFAPKAMPAPATPPAAAATPPRMTYPDAEKKAAEK